MATTPRFAVVELAVEDMARTLDFYRRLGLEVPPGSDDQPHVEALLPGGLKVVFDTIETLRALDPDWEGDNGGGGEGTGASAPTRDSAGAGGTGGPGISLAFECGSPADVDAVYGELVAAGYRARKEPWDAFWGMRYAVVGDPDGYGVDLFALLPPPPEPLAGEP
ncbi:glyoxalase [Streptomyces armeniacus]|uniref:Glyoxalase n=1 Tax=Streptomyces armeniacus TaxID=83291 RepID=A0A345XXG1_9ACTN|nr:VOC family protein [Streptomyces armeniacus]AXK36327.1 glyoxalase [Streptomyces armeniacus]